MIKKAIIPAAGIGTRNLPITKVLPKEMLPICDRPAIDFLIEEAINSGIEQILIVVSRSKNMILDYYDRSIELESFLKTKNKENLLTKIDIPNVHIQYVRQTYAKGLGDAILLGKHFVGDEPFAVMLPDEILLSEKVPALQQLIHIYSKYKGNVLGLKQMDAKELQKYGVIKPEKLNDLHYKILEIIEKPEVSFPSNLAVIGRYILEPTIFEYLSKAKPGVGGEIQLTDAINNMIEATLCTGVEVEGKRFDIATLSDYVKLINLIFSLNHTSD